MNRSARFPAGLAMTCLAALGGCSGYPDAGDPSAHESAKQPRILAAAFECDDGSAFIVHFHAESARLVQPADGRVLRREVSASGEKFTADGMLVWSKGDEALIEIDGRRYRGCRDNPADTAWEQARIDGVDFRALGNEPGWILELDEDGGVTFVTDYGQTRHRFDRPARHRSPHEGPVRYIATGDDGEIIILLTTAACLDDMSGAPFPVRADVRFKDRDYRGCGRMLRETAPHD